MAAPTYVGLFSSQNTNSSTGITRNWPAGHAAGDVAMVFLAYRYGDGMAGRPTVTHSTVTFHEAPGFPILLDTPSSGLDTDKVYLTVYYGYATGSSLAAISISGSNWFRQNSLCIRGTGGSGSIIPYNNYVTSMQTDTTLNSVAFPALTTTSADTLFLHYAICTTIPNNNAANFAGTLTNADLTGITTQSNLGSTTAEGAGHIFITGTRAGTGTSAAGTGITTSAASTSQSVIFAMGGTPYVPSADEKYFFGANGSYILKEGNLIDLTTGKVMRVNNMDNMIIVLETGKIFYKIQDNVLVEKL